MGVWTIDGCGVEDEQVSVGVMIGRALVVVEVYNSNAGDGQSRGLVQRGSKTQKRKKMD